MEEYKKKVISGTIEPRWPKKRVVKWLELGAIPAIVGMWIPDWAGQYIHQMSGEPYIFPPSLAFPPIITYIGAVILLKACLEGIKDMGWHYKGAKISGIAAITCAGLSVVSHFFIHQGSTIAFAVTILFIGLAAFFATGFLWLTIAKVAEISDETRTKVTKNIVMVLNLAAITAGAITVISILLNSGFWPELLRLTVVLFTLAFLFCRYGVYCYKTQKSIGADFVVPPEEQFWI